MCVEERDDWMEGWMISGYAEMGEWVSGRVCVCVCMGVGGVKGMPRAALNPHV